MLDWVLSLEIFVPQPSVSRKLSKNVFFEVISVLGCMFQWKIPSVKGLFLKASLAGVLDSGCCHVVQRVVLHVVHLRLGQEVVVEIQDRVPAQYLQSAVKIKIWRSFLNSF